MERLPSLGSVNSLTLTLTNSPGFHMMQNVLQAGSVYSMQRGTKVCPEIRLVVSP